MRRAAIRLWTIGSLMLMPARGLAEDLVDDAMKASGADARTRDAFRDWEREAGSLRRIESSADRAAGLLRWLHAGRLKTYQADATTLSHVLLRGEYNCVSSALVYNLLAERIGLEVQTELLPTHARSLVRVGEDWVVVETTTPEGFSPTPSDSQQILEQVAGAIASEDRTFVDRKGERHPSRALVAVTYVNRAIFAQRAGRTEQAERLYAAAESVALASRFGAMVSEQRATLLSQLAAQSAERSRYEEAADLLRQALELEGTDPVLRRVLSVNAVAYTQRVLRSQVDAGQVSRVVRGLEQHSYVEGLDAGPRAQVEAFGWGEVANHHAQARRWEASLKAYALALSNASKLDPSLRGTLQRNRSRSNLSRAREWARSGRLDAALATVSDPTERQSLYESAVDRAVTEEDNAAVDATTQACLKAHPDSTFCLGNRVAFLQRSIQGRLKGGQCDAARSPIQELRKLTPGDRFAQAVQTSCWVRKARDAYQRDQYEQAANSLVQAVKVDGADATVRTNLEVVFEAWAARAEGAACRSLLELRRQAQRSSDGLKLAGCSP